MHFTIENVLLHLITLCFVTHNDNLRFIVVFCCLKSEINTTIKQKFEYATTANDLNNLAMHIDEKMIVELLRTTFIKIHSISSHDH